MPVTNSRPKANLDRQFMNGWQRRTLIEALGGVAAPAAADFAAIATRYDISKGFVRDFAYDNRLELERYRAEKAVDPNNRFAGMWVQDREKRIEEYLTEVRTINRVLDKLRDEGRDEEDVYDRFMKMKMMCLEVIAKELGQSKPELDVGGNVSFTINGIDLGAIK